MADISSIIQTINEKVDRLTKRCDLLHESNNALEAEKVDLEQKVDEQSIEIEELNAKNKVLKMAGALAGGDTDQSEAKQKINELVREIDKCIALLNR